MHSWTTVKTLVNNGFNLDEIFTIIHEKKDAYIELDAGDNDKIRSHAMYLLPKEVISALHRRSLIHGENFSCHLEVLHPFKTKKMGNYQVFLTMTEYEELNQNNLPPEYTDEKAKIPDGFRISDVRLMTVQAAKDSGLSDESAVAQARASIWGQKTYLNNICTTTKKVINIGDIFVEKNILGHLPNKHFPPHCDPNHAEYSERIKSLNAIMEAQALNKYPELSHTKLVVQILKDHGHNYEEKDEVTKHFVYMTSPTWRKNLMKKN